MVIATALLDLAEDLDFFDRVVFEAVLLFSVGIK
jgi:hypothetical protein